MLPTELSVLQTISKSVVDPVTYVVLSLFLALVLYLVIGIMWDIQHNYKVTLSLALPFILLEFVLSSVFSVFGINLDWGTYSYNFYALGEYTITSFVMGSKFLGYIFDFGMFTHIGLPYFTEFAKNIPVALPDPGFLFKSFVFLYVSVDSIIDFIFFYFLFMALIVITEDLFGGDNNIALIVSGTVSVLAGVCIWYFFGAGVESIVWLSGLLFVLMYGVLQANIQNAKINALWLAAIPTILYAWFISNPIVEYGVAIPELMRVFWFFENADGWNLIVFFGTLVLSFALVVMILATAIDLFYRAGATSFKPDWETKIWTSNQMGVAFISTLAFSIMYAMHSYSWYIFFPFLIFYTLFKKLSGGLIETAAVRTEKMNMENTMIERVRGAVHNKSEINTSGIVDARNGIDVGQVLVGAAVVGGLIYWYFGGL